MLKSISLTVVTLAFAFIILSPNAISAKESSFKLGLMLCLTGGCAEWGQNSLKGIQLAVDEINESGGVLSKKIEILTQDTRESGNGANAVTAYRSLVLDKDIKYFIGPTWSIGGLPLAPILSRKEDQLITSPSLGVAKFNETASNLFNTWPHDSYATEALARYAIDKGWKKAVLFSGNDPWVMTQGNTFETEFKRLGGTVLIKIENDPNTTNVKAEVLKIKKLNPDLVFYSDTYNMSKAARELRSLKYKGKQLAILMDETRIKEANGALEGTVFAMYPNAEKSFSERFFDKFGEQPGITADTAYDTVMLYAEAIKQSNTFEVSTVKKILAKLKHAGASGEIVFDKHGGVVRTPLFWMVENNAYKQISNS